jgi:hypothetical protein
MTSGEYEPFSDNDPNVSIPTGEYTPVWTSGRGGGRGAPSYIIDKFAILSPVTETPETFILPGAEEMIVSSEDIVLE